MKIGVLGGTFDPVHLGHLAVAEEARVRVGLVQVIFMPAGKPWMKKNMPVSAAEHRLNMLKLAIAGNPYFNVSTIEIKRPGLSYAVDTLLELKNQLGVEYEIFFIMGWDSIAWLPQWREPSRFIELCRIIAAPRPGYSRPDLEAMETALPGISQRVVMLDKPELAISATEIRKRVKSGLPISHLVPGAVEKYIKENRLYEQS